MNFRRNHPRRQVRCAMCTPHRMGNVPRYDVPPDRSATSTIEEFDPDDECWGSYEVERTPRGFHGGKRHKAVRPFTVEWKWTPRFLFSRWRDRGWSVRRRYRNERERDQALRHFTQQASRWTEYRVGPTA